MALEQAISKARNDGVKIEDENLQHILPTMIEHPNFIGTFFVINVTGCHISNDLPNRAS